MHHFFFLFVLLLASVHAEVPQLIQQAGNSNDEHERLTALEQLSAETSLDATLGKELGSLIEFVKKWNGGSLKFYGASVRGKPHRAIGDYDFGVAKDSPLWPICELYRGRMLAWTLIENSTVRTHPKDSKWFKDEAVASFQRVKDAFPKNTVARMYLGAGFALGRGAGEGR